MASTKLDYLNTYESRGKWYGYYRRAGQRIRLRGEVGSPEFLRHYADVHRDFDASQSPQPRIKSGSMNELITRYKSSADFAQLAARTKKEYVRFLDIIGELSGDMPVATMPRKFVLKLRDSLADKPRTANHMMAVLRLLMQHGIDLGYRETNPASRPKRLKEGDGFRAWEEHEITQFRDRWEIGTQERAAFELILYTGQRASDVRTMQRGQIRNNWISVRQQKTGARVDIPLANALRMALEPWLANHDHLTLLPAPKGNPFDNSAFSKFMRKAYAQADLPTDFKTHGGRYAAATRLRELRLGWEEIGAITGHDTAQMVRKYSEQKRAAKYGVDKMNAADAASRVTNISKSSD